MNLFQALFRLSYRGTSWTIREAVEVYQILMFFIGAAVLVVLTGFVFNVVGWKVVNIFLSLLFTAGFAIFAFQPMALAITAGLGGAVGALRQDQSASAGSIRFLENYLNILKQVFLWGSVMLFLLGTMSFQESPMAFFSLTAAILTLTFIRWAWNIGENWGKKATYWYVCVMTIVSFLVLIPGPLWVKYTPWDPKTELGTSPVEDSLYEIRKARQEKLDETRNEALITILSKVKDEETLSSDEEKFLSSFNRDNGNENQKIQRVTQDPSTGLVDFTVPAEGTLRVAIKHGLSYCLESDLVNVLLPDGRRVISGPETNYNLGKVPTDSVLEYSSATGKPVNLKCHNVSISPS